MRFAGISQRPCSAAAHPPSVHVLPATLLNGAQARWPVSLESSRIGNAGPRSRAPRGRPCAAAAPLTLVQEVAVTQADAAPVEAPTEPLSDLADPEALARAARVEKQLVVGYGPLGRGLVATQALEARQSVVSVPLENALIITDEPLDGISVFGDRCLEAWQAAHGRMPEDLVDFLTGEARWDVRMTAFLLWVASEQPDSPVWGRYMANLPPAGEITCLLHYGPDVARELQFKELIDEAKTQHAWAMGVHRKYFDPKTGQLGQLRLAARVEDTMWAMSMVRTRTFSETVNGEALTLMVPYADLANHSFRCTGTFCMARDNKRFDLRLLAPLAEGEEATISYGEAKSNAEVMRDYGFVVPGNPNDRLRLPGLEQLPPLNGASLLESIGFKGDWREGTAAPKRPTLEASHGDPEARLVLARRRCVALSLQLYDTVAPPPPSSGKGGLLDGFAQPWSNSGRPPPQHVAPYALAPELEAVGAVRGVLQGALDELPTTIEQDEALLSSYGAAGAEAGAGAGAAAGLALYEAALRCRLEAKRLLREGVRVMDAYGAWLAERQQQQLLRKRRG
ncbi:hypothetical protein HYH03_002485 [Edaphochlamys debaryana]|uniref:SET domain-containing protein n=1 Tax=Edaphochlamys debaryana TaxID=47281 RepID=A0A836C575_9CHLO|nr:hypothetical protein HYH03_002485 [Edaphochlamys debaryana]|eukprot:KAG2499539.1 hypothetical protein HYH03_002485 [Edaphochlamys debaryana]